jgi:hypothetical protein
VVGIYAVFFCDRIEPDLARLHFACDYLADVLHRRQIFVIVFQRVVGVRVRRDDSPDSGRSNRLHVVIAQRHEKSFFAEAPDFMSAIPFRRAQNSEIFSHVVENLCRCPPNRLHAVIVGSDAVDEIQSVGAGLGV